MNPIKALRRVWRYATGKSRDEFIARMESRAKEFDEGMEKVYRRLPSKKPSPPLVGNGKSH